MGLRYIRIEALLIDQSKDKTRSRVAGFWRDMILPLRGTGSSILIVTHGGPIRRLKEYLREEGYRIHSSVNSDSTDPWSWESKHCSIFEIILDKNGPGEYVRIDDCRHLTDQDA